MKGLMILCLLLSGQLLSSEINPQRLVVKIKTGEQNQALTEGLRHLFGQYYVLETQDVDTDFHRLNQNDWVDYVDYDYRSSQTPVAKAQIVDLDKALNDPRSRSQWHLAPSARHGVSVIEAYENQLSVPQQEIIVAVVDTGVDYKHADLKEQMWVNSGEIAGNGIDDDGNGYIDDVHGIDTLGRDSQGKATGDPMDTHGHGTHVSGIIGAKQNNNLGVAGVAVNVKIMAIRTVPNRGDETDVDVAESFIYAAKMGARVINCSFGKRVNEGGMVVSEAIDFIAREYGVLVVAASGNESTNIDRSMRYPASFQNESLMVVASTQRRGRMSGFSNYGIKNVDIAAPGSSILSTVRGGRYGNMSGTSMASPVAAGIAAETLANAPEMTPLELKKHLMDNVVPVRAFSGRVVSGGRIDLKTSLENL